MRSRKIELQEQVIQARLDVARLELQEDKERLAAAELTASRVRNETKPITIARWKLEVANRTMRVYELEGELAALLRSEPERLDGMMVLAALDHGELIAHGAAPRVWSELSTFQKRSLSEAALFLRERQGL